MKNETLPHLDLTRLTDEERVAVQRYGELVLLLEAADMLTQHRLLTNNGDNTIKEIVDKICDREFGKPIYAHSAEEVRSILGLG